jgi:excisionase family DNA binding protein
MAKCSVVSPRYFNKPSAAKYLSCTTRFLELAVKSGRLRAFKPTNGLIRFKVADLDAFMESGGTKPVSEGRKEQ